MSQPARRTSTKKPPPAAVPATLWEKLDEICESKSRAKWRNVPPDLAKNLKHYLYGLPKQ